MREELEKKKKIKKLAEAAGAGGIKNSISKDTQNKIVKGVKSIGKKVAEAGSQTVGSMAKDLLKKKQENKIKRNQEDVERETGKYQVKNLSKATKERDKQQEIQAVKRYKNSPASDSPLDIKDGIVSKGIFSLYVKNKKKK